MRIITNLLIKNYKLHLLEEEKSKSTQEKYIRDINAFNIWICSKDVNKEKVLEYKVYLCNKYKLTSANSVISSLNSFFNYNKWYDCKLKTVKFQKQYFISDRSELNINDYFQLLNHAKNNKKLYLVIQTICSTGIRVSELRFITVNSVVEKKAIINLKGKIRVVILPDELCKILNEYIEQEKIITGSIFLSKNGNPLNRSNIWTQMKNLCKKTDIPKEKVYPHNLRHLFARTYYSQQKDISMLADILGHSNINTTRIYTLQNIETHRKNVQTLNLVKY